MPVRSTVPFRFNRGTEITDYLVGQGVQVTQVDVDPTGAFLLIDADRDVTALMAAYNPPAELARTRDKVLAALQGKNYGEAITRLLAAISLSDD